MRSIALRTRLKPGMEAVYEEVHRTIPAELAAAISGAGVRSWRIWRDGLDLFHVVDVDDFQHLQEQLAHHPANLVWQERMAELLDVEFTYSDAGAGLPLVWDLAEQVSR
ncbi:L-rhamnose mutarotase [Pseudactinotalea suaedae]|uniref:L-rhamnose mutarotase n=1 Tax=Pseudactinotalea suaedae TaxID=1524924 RepID=UPI0012E268BD|nr:L-rhamnose mutarotase [Pseudactinotalea suaedae]